MHIDNVETNFAISTTPKWSYVICANIFAIVFLFSIMKLQVVSNAISNSHMTPPGSKYICRTHFLPTCDPSRVVQHAKPVCQLIPSNYCNVHDTGGSHNCSNHVCIQESVTPAGSHVCSNHSRIQESMTPEGSHVGRKRNWKTNRPRRGRMWFGDAISDLASIIFIDEIEKELNQLPICFSFIWKKSLNLLINQESP